MSNSARAVLVTGSSRGIGAAIAQRFASNGDRVAVHYRCSRDAAMTTLRSLEGEGHCLIAADISEPRDAKRLIESAVGSLGGLDVLVNNAGVYIPHPLRTVSYADWQRLWAETMATNLSAVANLTWCAVPHLAAGGRGRIVNISSKSAYDGDPIAPAYGASKAALIALSHALARDLGTENISVTTVAPGWTETDMAFSALQGDSGKEIRARSPFRRVALSGEIADAVLYLASPGAEFASGTVLDINGASYLHL
jgi:3-oxoacyl-[acyl-carrier protein] reductase